MASAQHTVPFDRSQYKPLTVGASNKAFLELFFGPDWESVPVASFAGDPAAARRDDWAAYPAKDLLPRMSADRNNFFTLSLFDGPGRKEDLFREMRVWFFDDVGTKTKLDEVLKLGPPTVILETSPGNESWYYRTRVPKSQSAELEYLRREVTARVTLDQKDAGDRDVTRYSRLPVGSNLKAKNGPGGWKIKVLHWDDAAPEITLGDIARVWSVDLTLAPPRGSRSAVSRVAGPGGGPGAPGGHDPVLGALSRLGLLLGRQTGNGYYEIHCPWEHEHTGRAETGAGWHSYWGFQCFHGHCRDRDSGHFLRWLRETHGTHLSGEAFAGADRHALGVLARALVDRSVQAPPGEIPALRPDELDLVSRALDQGLDQDLDQTCAGLDAFDPDLGNALRQIVEHIKNPPPPAGPRVQVYPRPPRAPVPGAPNEIEDVNKTRFVTDVGGKTVVVSEFINERGHPELSYSSPTDFKGLFAATYISVKHNGATKEVPLGPYWWNHRNRRQYKGIICDPLDTYGSDYFNKWDGFAVQPRPANWDKLYRHIHEVICGGDPALTEWLLSWCAKMVQDPAYKVQSCIVMRGGEGTGKGTLAQVLLKIFGPHAFHATRSDDLLGKFNAHLDGCFFLFCDETFYAGDKAASGLLKALLTEPTLVVERKYLPKTEVPNKLHVMMASNESWVVPAGPDARRYVILDVSDKRKGDRAYFDALWNEIDGDGAAGFLWDLLRADLTGWDDKIVPNTAGLADQKLLSLTGVARWWLDVLVDGVIPPQAVPVALGSLAPPEDWPDKVDSSGLYEAYARWARDCRSEYRSAGKVTFWKELRRLMGGRAPKQRGRAKGTRVQRVVLPKLPECRGAFEKYLGSDIPWDDTGFAP